ncbi:hypothetical protein KSF_109410 [Reticulibacter mediterranei]|uniref:Methyltransferase domain-containing protein n=1 Tax=Reticulibacter mediterranei TaxID=2778369 RepID=A0A8J3IUJ8_9CHLR|nr:class I SAM-dependent methyltransferase [Reticulibacter mediterranei]GHP00894.1 hypothetical protein KSF_109410 [Reticulibacter mediterranei]
MNSEPANNNTYIFDPESPTEMARLINQDRVMTQAMGGALPNIADLSNMRSVLDLGCGPGGWAMDVAFQLPEAEVTGVDVSRIMIDYANARADTHDLPNVIFKQMDITQPFAFPDASFDLVNQRFLGTVLKREAWLPFLKECTRVLRPGGQLRLTEMVGEGMTSSAAVNHFMRLIVKLFWKIGYGFSPDGESWGIVHAFPQLLRALGHDYIQIFGYGLEYSFNTTAWSDQYHNIEISGIQIKQTMVDFGLISSKDFDYLHQQAIIDMHQKDFQGLISLHTFLARKPIEVEEVTK